MAAVARQNILCCCKCVAWKNCLQEYSLLCCLCQFEAEAFSVRDENYCLARWCLPTLQQCVWQPLLASYLLFQCLGDCLMFKGRNITADCISCIVPPFFPPSFLLPPFILFEEGRIEFWLKCCRNCTASALWCQHVMYGLGWKRLWLPQRSQRICVRLDNFLPL